MACQSGQDLTLWDAGKKIVGLCSLLSLSVFYFSLCSVVFVMHSLYTFADISLLRSLIILLLEWHNAKLF